MRVLITGVAGFVGSNTAEAALRRGWQVRGIDALTDYYDPALKRRNLEAVAQTGSIDLVVDDLLTTDLAALLDGVDAVIHLAAQPGVRDSWGQFGTYVAANVLATQRLLEALRQHPVARLVYASSSSAYGDAPAYPVFETDLPRPRSPYGVTKLAAEQLCVAYAANFGISSVSLRYFTVYGPRQRPDMATNRLIAAARFGTPFPMFGDGSQIRDFTFVDDVVAANLDAVEADVAAGSVFNVAGGDSCTLAELIDLVGREVGSPVPLDRRPAQPGDVFRTGGDITAAIEGLGWRPTVSVAEGVKAQVAWALANT
jgi:nucleoside-diphosphate-sugar epimerase